MIPRQDDHSRERTSAACDYIRFGGSPVLVRQRLGHLLDEPGSDETERDHCRAGCAVVTLAGRQTHLWLRSTASGRIRAVSKRRTEQSFPQGSRDDRRLPAGGRLLASIG